MIGIYVAVKSGAPLFCSVSYERILDVVSIKRKNVSVYFINKSAKIKKISQLYSHGQCLLGVKSFEDNFSTISGLWDGINKNYVCRYTRDDGSWDRMIIFLLIDNHFVPFPSLFSAKQYYHQGEFCGENFIPYRFPVDTFIPNYEKYRIQLPLHHRIMTTQELEHRYLYVMNVKTCHLSKKDLILLFDDLCDKDFYDVCL